MLFMLLCGLIAVVVQSSQIGFQCIKSQTETVAENRPFDPPSKNAAGLVVRPTGFLNAVWQWRPKQPLGLECG